MFKTIFSYEFKRWLKSPLFYVYASIFFVIGFFIMAGNVGYFDSFTVSTGSNAYSNSAIAINSLLNGTTTLIYFLLPTIIGASVYRDFKYNMHHIMFSYPFTKTSYLFAKFFSSFCVVLCIIIVMACGVYLASILPFANPDKMQPNRLMSYIEPFLYYIIPNLIFYGVIIFAIVTFTRNISVGFMVVVVLIFGNSLISSFAKDSDHLYLLGLLDPDGNNAMSYITKYWTVDEQNNNSLPFEGIVLYNRLLWLGVSALIFGVFYYFFSFTQTAFSFRSSKKQERITKNNFGSITTIELPKVSFDYSLIQRLKTAWSLSNVDFKSIVKNWIFISIVFLGLVFIFLTSLSIGQFMGTKTYPVTWQMLAIPGSIFYLFINILTFLFTGILVHRSATSRIKHLIDVTPTPNWVLFLSKFIATVKMQIVLLSVIMFGGIMIQIFRGFYDFEIGHYLFELFVIKLSHFLVWTIFSLFVHTLLKNYLLGFFTLLLLSIVISFLPMMGVEQTIYRFNSDSGFSYSDLNGYGDGLMTYFLYKLYWILLCLALFGISLLFYVRGVGQPMKNRFIDARKRFKPAIAVPIILSLVAFVSLGATFYYYDNIKNVRYSDKESEQQNVDFEKKFKKLQHRPQPRIVDVKVDMNLFPEERNLVANGTYILKNKTKFAIDSLLVNTAFEKTTLNFSVAHKRILNDTVMNFMIYKLEKPLLPGDSIQMTFSLKNKPNSVFEDNSEVKYNGTFINNGIFPSLGYDDNFEIEDDDTRKDYGLKPKERMASPTDSIARQNTYISKDADWITFETTVSTSADQTAIAPGYLTKKWTEKGRNYFHYKMDKKMLNFYAYNSARYEVKKDQWNGINIEIYYNKKHAYNIDRMIFGIKKSLAYYSENYSPYQFKQVRIIEFPSGGFAQSFANTIPFSENVGFIAEVDDKEKDAVDYTFQITNHEVAHQWWAHQVIGANVQGVTLMSESMSEYSSLKVLEHTYGKSQMRKFLKNALDDYLTGRSFEGKKEQPLMFNENQQYIHYKKGSLVLYALSDYIGEKNMNNALSGYLKKVAFQEAPYTNSIEFVDALRTATPDSLKYVINDMFETITLYDNKVVKASQKKLANGNYQVDFEFEVAKYKADMLGKKIYKDQNGKTLSYKTKKANIQSYPMNDYIEVGIFTTDKKNNEKELYLKKIKITQINNKISIIVKEKPTEVGIDPYNKLIDTKSDDNRQKM